MGESRAPLLQSLLGLTSHCVCQTHNHSKKVIWKEGLLFAMEFLLLEVERGMFRKVFCSGQFLLAQRVLSTGLPVLSILLQKT